MAGKHPRDSMRASTAPVCFVGGTLVHTENGLVPIKDIKVGEKVLSKPENGEGELVYKPVLRTIVTDDVPVYFSTFTPESVDDLNYTEKYDLSLYADVLCTANHPFWVVGKGWVEAQQLQLDDDVLLKNGETAYCNSCGFDDEGIEMVFKTDDPEVGYIPDFAEQTNDGRFVDLTTGRTLRYGGYAPVFNKLFVQDTEWKQRLLAQLPAAQRAGADFFGFRTGFWQDSAGIDWEDGQGPVTTTVYNLKVANTHTYFVGEAGIWVHDADVTTAHQSH